MQRKIKNKFIILLLALVALFVFGGCSLTQGLEDIKNHYDLNPQVTYYSNGGAFEDSASKKEMFYKIGSKAMNIGFIKATSSHKPNVQREGYKLLGWYFVELDNEGNPVFENGESGAYKLTEAVDFTKALQEDEHWIIAAKWQALVGVKVMMVCEEGSQVEVGNRKDGIAEDVTSFANGDLIGELNYNSRDVVEPYSATPDMKFFTVKDNAFTFLGYFMDEACETPAPTVLQRGEEDIVLYAKYLTGNWKFVSTPDDVKDMFSSMGLGQASNHYWLLNDIDCGSLNREVDVLANFRGTLQGNGFTIRNLKLRKALTQGSAQAVFGNLTVTAKMENVTFENLQVTYTMRTAIHAEGYFVFLSKDENATVNNVTMTGTLTTSGPVGAVVDNLVNIATGTPRYDHCLYGGYETDSEYTGGGFNVTLTQVNGETPTQQ